MAFDVAQFESRKRDHIQLALMPENQTTELNSLDSITLIHEALPDCDLRALSVASTRFASPCDNPFIVSSMTAGHEHASTINRNLMSACVQNKWAMGVGSQRRELQDPNASAEWKTLRKLFPTACLYSNLGIAQLITTPIDKVLMLCEHLEASAMIIHCNPLQESIQPEGTPEFKGSYAALEVLVKTCPVPVVIKETGCGFSAKTMKRLDNIGVSAIDVSGLGGTHWGRIEGHRAKSSTLHQDVAHSFRNWGISTKDCLLQAENLNLSCELWGSGGIRHGLDAAKVIALGATTVGFAKPLLQPALESDEAVNKAMQRIEHELKVAMFCTGSNTLMALKDAL